MFILMNSILLNSKLNHNANNAMVNIDACSIQLTMAGVLSL